MLAVAQFTPLFFAVLIGWMFSVCVHEFAHAVVAYWGGDRSVRERGYLNFNPLRYLDPVTSLLIPAVFLMLGGLPLPGGAVQIDSSQLRSKHWDALVSAAGPASNVLLFLVIAVVIHPQTGLVDPSVYDQPNWVKMLGALAVLQLLSVFFNLIPIPPLDGFGIIEPYLDYETRMKARQMGFAGLIMLYIAFANFDPLMEAFQNLVDRCMKSVGLPYEVTWRQFNFALFGRSE